MSFRTQVFLLILGALLFARNNVFCESLSEALSDEDIYQIIDLATTGHKLERKPEIYYAAAPNQSPFQSMRSVNAYESVHAPRELSRNFFRPSPLRSNDNNKHQQHQNRIPLSKQAGKKSAVEIFGSLELPSEHSKYVQDPSGRFVRILQQSKPELIDGTQKAHVSSIRSSTNNHGTQQLVAETVASMSHQIVHPNHLVTGPSKNTFVFLKNSQQQQQQFLNVAHAPHIFNSVPAPTPPLQTYTFTQVSPSPAPPTPTLMNTLAAVGNPIGVNAQLLPIQSPPLHHQPTTYALPAQQAQDPANNHQMVHLHAVNAALAKAREVSNKDPEQHGANSPVVPIQNVQLVPEQQQQQQFVHQPLQYGQGAILQAQQFHQQQVQLQHSQLQLQQPAQILQRQPLQYQQPLYALPLPHHQNNIPVYHHPHHAQTFINNQQPAITNSQNNDQQNHHNQNQAQAQALQHAQAIQEAQAVHQAQATAHQNHAVQTQAINQAQAVQQAQAQALRQTEASHQALHQSQSRVHQTQSQSQTQILHQREIAHEDRGAHQDRGTHQSQTIEIQPLVQTQNNQANLIPQFEQQSQVQQLSPSSQIISPNPQVIDGSKDESTLPISDESLDDSETIHSLPLVVNEAGNPEQLTSEEEALVLQAHQHQPEVQIRHFNGEPVVTIKTRRIITRPVKSKSQPNAPGELKKSVVTTRVVARFKDPKDKKKIRASKKRMTESRANPHSDLMTSA